MRIKQFITSFIAITVLSFTSNAQGLYSKSLSVYEIDGVFINGDVTIETPNAIASNKNKEYVSMHLGEYSNISMMWTERLRFEGKTYYIWQFNTEHKSEFDDEGYSCTEYLVLTEEQNESLRKAGESDICLVKLPMYSTIASYRHFNEAAVIDGIKEAILEVNDARAHTYCMTVREKDGYVMFNYEIDCWSFSGNINNRTYEKLDLMDNLDGGYFRMTSENWGRLFYR